MVPNDILKAIGEMSYSAKNGSIGGGSIHKRDRGNTNRYMSRST